MYINNERMTESTGIKRIKKFIGNNKLEYKISFLEECIIIRRYKMLGNDAYIKVLKIRCTERQYKIIDMLVH